MTATKQFLRIMATGEPQSIKAMVKLTGLSEQKVKETIAHMRQFGYLESSPVTYQITDKGIERSMFEPKVPSQPRKRQPKPVDAVGHAIRNQPNSVFALGGMNA